ncbi:uncharacterized protein [Penaeus vannamei]|uniref:uncharacterized protein n=1 Tax=Penaeus vannamei TaxID=6689 RepID=UPI00387F49D9
MSRVPLTIQVLYNGSVMTLEGHMHIICYCILALRVTVERRREFGRGLLEAYIDRKKAFNTVHRKSLFEILRLRGVPTRIIGLIGSLYTGTERAADYHCGATLGNIKVTDLDFADDIAILSESLETLMVALDTFSNDAKPLGLEVSWTKTKIQNIGDLLREPVRSVRACGEDTEVTECFTYMQFITLSCQTRKSADGLSW